MAKLIYSALTSLDGYIEDLDGRFDVEHAKDVSESLLTRRPDRDARVGARLLEKACDRIGDGASISPDMESRDGIERIGDGTRQLGERRLVAFAKRMQVLLRVTEREE